MANQPPPGLMPTTPEGIAQRRAFFQAQGYPDPYEEASVPDNTNLAVPVPGATTGQPPPPPAAAATLAVSPAKRRLGKLDEMYSQQQQSLADLYGSAAEQLRNRYAGPTQSDMLLAIGQALMAPTDSGRFLDSLANIPGAMLGYSKERRESRNTLEDKLLELKLQHAKELNDLQTKYMGYRYKSPTGHVTVNPVTGDTVDTQTGFPMPNPQQVADLLKNPDEASKAGYDMAFGPGAADYAIENYGSGGEG